MLKPKILIEVKNGLLNISSTIDADVIIIDTDDVANGECENIDINADVDITSDKVIDLKIAKHIECVGNIKRSLQDI